MKFTNFTFFLFFVFQISISQNNEQIPKGFKKLDGIEYVGKIKFYLEEKTQTILAYKSGKVKWKIEVVKFCGKPSVGEAEIREVRIQNKYLKIVYGKHSFAKIEIETGEIICEGED